MAFWNRKKKRQQEALEREIQEKLDAIREKKKAEGRTDASAESGAGTEHDTDTEV